MSSLRLTNSLTSRTEAFEPLEAGKATIYCCGVTVYDLCHLGHARSYINWDVLRRYLIWRGYDVTYVQNYTDIDDKILNRAAEEGSTMEAVSERNIEAFEIDMGRLNILPADRMPRATCCIEGIQTLIAELEAKGAAYSSDGDVYFDISKAKDYGKLNQRIPSLYIKLYMYQMARSLAYIHSLGVCHRDIKPQNLLVNTTTHQLKLCDFGSAKILVRGEPNISYICSRYYRAPELIFGATAYTTATDIW